MNMPHARQDLTNSILNGSAASVGIVTSSADDMATRIELDGDLLSAIDSLLEEGAATKLNFLRASLLTLDWSKSAGHLMGTIGKLLARDALSLENASIALFDTGSLLRAMELLRKAQPGDRPQGTRLCEDYLTSWPPEIARLRLAHERGLIAGTVLAQAIEENDPPLSIGDARTLTGLWRDGTRSLLRTFASAYPDYFGESDLPASERLNLDAIEERHRARQAASRRSLDRAKRAREEARPTR